MKEQNKIKIKIPRQLYLKMLEDLKREHLYAHERVGFLFTTTKQFSDNRILILAKEYIPVDDGNYIEDNSVGAKINSTAIRNAMQKMMDKDEGCFHVHLHNHSGAPTPSFTDEQGLPDVIRSFANVSQKQANGILILSEDSFYATVKLANDVEFITPSLISVVGYPLRMRFLLAKRSLKSKILNRQSFLGSDSQHVFENIQVGIIGYGGGGSHIGQQLAHLGVKNILVFDDDKVEETNLNRLVGAWFTDIKGAILKTSIAKRVIKKVLPIANVSCINSRWQENPESLQNCDIVFGCIDSYIERQQLEAECRRYLIPYIDLGMDVYEATEEAFSMSGQVILSMPETSCMKCYGFLTDKKLAFEAAKYGAVGGRPQVVWANGVLASTAVGIFVDIVTGWTKVYDKRIYISYDGNASKLEEHPRLSYSDINCKHFPISEIGTPLFKKL